MFAAETGVSLSDTREALDSGAATAGVSFELEGPDSGVLSLLGLEKCKKFGYLGCPDSNSTRLIGATGGRGEGIIMDGGGGGGREQGVVVTGVEDGGVG